MVEYKCSLRASDKTDGPDCPQCGSQFIESEAGVYLFQCQSFYNRLTGSFHQSKMCKRLSTPCPHCAGLTKVGRK